MLNPATKGYDPIREKDSVLSKTGAEVVRLGFSK